ncbi:hypothetical protein STEG23_010945 [Scotinomys teguina]
MAQNYVTSARRRVAGVKLRLGLSRPLHVVERLKEGGAQRPSESQPAAPVQEHPRSAPLTLCDSVSPLIMKQKVSNKKYSSAQHYRIPSSLSPGTQKSRNAFSSQGCSC